MGATEDTWGHVDDRESIAAIHQAVDCGINLIDTAPIYGLGHSEEIVGKAVKGRRAEVVLATKCGLLFPSSPQSPPVRSLTQASIVRECEDSLRRLQTDHIDLYQCHWPDPQTPIRETMGALTTLLAEGKIRALGVSNFSTELITAAREYGPIHALQPPFSMLDRHAADDLIPYCSERRIAVVPYGPLAKGLLTGKFSADSRFHDVRTRDPEFLGARYRRNLGVVEALRPFAEKYGKTLAQLAINWTAYHPGVTAPIAGAKRPSQVLENAGGIGWMLSTDDRLAIDRILEKSGDHT